VTYAYVVNVGMQFVCELALVCGLTGAGITVRS